MQAAAGWGKVKMLLASCLMGWLYVSLLEFKNARMLQYDLVGFVKQTGLQVFLPHLSG